MRIPGAVAVVISGVPRAAEAGEDLAALGEVPVAEGHARHPPARGPRAAPQDLVGGAEEDLRVLAVGVGRETGVAAEVARRPLPAVAEHAECAAVGGTGRDA